MAVAVKHIGSLLDSEILALTSSSDKWFEKAFYYPADYPRLNYFYRLLDGEMYKIGGSQGGTAVGGIGVTLNGNVIGGIKTLIKESEILDIPENYDYNTYKLNVEGVINVDGQINIM